MGFQSFDRRRSKDHAFAVLFLLLYFNCVSGDNNITSRSGHGDTGPPPHEFSYKASISFRPSIVIVVAVLTTLFSITFLFLLYVKHCRNVGNHPSDRVFSYSNSVYERKSGIDRTVVESLPVFRFGSLTGQKEGLECAVCLNVFEVNEVLRLLPKCKHAFHVECVDTWLDAHSTCPLCRYRVDPEDLLLIIENIYSKSDEISEEDDKERESQPRRVPGRHSFAGVRDRERGRLFSFRMSLDGFRWKRKSGNEGGGDRYLRKDGSLMTKSGDDSGGDRGRIERRINVVGPLQRWSDSSLLLCVRSEMLMASPSMTRNKGPYVAGRCLSDMTKMGRVSASEARRVEVVAKLLGWAPRPLSGGESFA